MDQQLDRNQGVWTAKESLQYAIFLHINKKFLNQNRKRDRNFFVTLATFIETRSWLQCRNHHYKTLRRLKSINNIIMAKKKEIGLSTFKKHHLLGVFKGRRLGSFLRSPTVRSTSVRIQEPQDR